MKFSTEKNYSSVELLHLGRDHFHSGQFLLENYGIKLVPYGEGKNQLIILLESGGYLVHLGFELIMKSYILENTGKFPHIHDLSKLMGSVNLPFDDNEKDLIGDIQKYSNLRYVKDENGRRTEVGNEDVEKYDALFSKFIDNLPEALKDQYDSIDSTRKCGGVLMRIRIDKDTQA